MQVKDRWRVRVRLAALVSGLLCFGRIASGQALTILTSPSAMTINTAVAGLPPTDRTSNVTNYIITGKKNRAYKITGRLSAVMPPGVSLTVTLTAPTGATSSGPVTLDATARDLVGNITNTVAETQQITYVLSATPAAGVVTAQSRTVTFTIAAWP